MAISKQVEISLVIPVYNEVDNVEGLYNEIAEVLSSHSYSYEVVFVDDGSSDGTQDALHKLAGRYENIKPVYHKRNFGQSAALVSGARAASYPLLITLDGDGQNDPADIPAMLAQYADNKTVVLGNRRKRDDNLLRKLSSRIGNNVRRGLLRDECPDTGCSLKLFSKEGFLALPHFNHLHRFLPALFKRAGFRLVNIQVNHRARQHGVSKYGVMNRLFAGIYDLVGVRWLLNRPCTPETINYES